MQADQLQLCRPHQQHCTPSDMLVQIIPCIAHMVQTALFAAHTDSWTDKRTDRQMDGWMDGWLHMQTHIHADIHTHRHRGRHTARQNIECVYVQD